MPDIHSIFRILKKTFRLQEKRMALFEKHFRPTPDTTILDIGGYHYYWGRLSVTPRITLLSRHPPRKNIPDSFIAVLGDGRRLQYDDKAFDITFSNSVIEHVGNRDQQQAFASELRRVGKRYYVQVPYRWSILEPHFLVLFIHWLPKPAYKVLVRWLSPWRWVTKASRSEVSAAIDKISLLSMSEMRRLFPDAEIHRERIFGFTKSLIAMKLTQ